MGTGVSTLRGEVLKRINDDDNHAMEQIEA